MISKKIKLIETKTIDQEILNREFLETENKTNSLKLNVFINSKEKNI